MFDFAARADRPRSSAFISGLGLLRILGFVAAFLAYFACFAVAK
jgi:hypothetical protein